MVVLDSSFQYAVVNKTYLRIEVDNREVVYNHGCSVSFSFEQSVAEAEFEVPYNYPADISKWSTVKIIIGANFETAKPRFWGYVLGMEPKLWPPVMVVKCRGMLVKAIYGFPPTSFGINLGEGTDEQIITLALLKSGIPTTMMDILGAGKILGSDMGLGSFGQYLTGDVPDVPAGYIWGANQSAMQLIQSIEQVTLGYRTHDTPSGVVLRRRFSTIPYSDAKYSFIQGDNIIDGSMSFKVKDPVDSVTIINRNGSITTYPPVVDTGAGQSTQTISSQWLIGDPTAGLDPIEVANWRLEQSGWTFISVSFSTYDDVDIRPGDTVYCESLWMRVNQNFYVQTVKHDVNDAGQYTQTLTIVSELGLGSYNPNVSTPVTPVTPPTGPVPAPVPPLLPGPVLMVEPQFTVTIMKESVETSGGGFEDLYDVFCDAAVGGPTTISNPNDYSWTAAGEGCRVTEGTGPTFTTGFSTLEGSTVTLTVAAISGTRAVDDGTGSVITASKLYSATATLLKAFDAKVWREYTSPFEVQVVGHGPGWGLAGGWVATSEDDLITAPLVSNALPSDITAIWLHEADENYVVVGGSDGQMAMTRDFGATWTRKTGPGGPIKYVISSIFNQTEWHVVTPDGWFKSQNEGDSWDSVVHGNFVYLELAPVRNIVVTNTGVLKKGEDGSPFSGNTAPVVAATAHIRSDNFYAVSSDGKTWATDSAGSYGLVERSPIPGGGIPHVGGMYRDGNIVDIVYVAASNGLWKTLDGFRTPGGYAKLLSPPV
jgi:hypothetical protein